MLELRAKVVVGIAAAIALGAVTPMTANAAGTAVYDTAPSTPGDQAYSDVLGDDFTVNAPGLTVVGLGAFDSGKAGLSTDIMIGLYNLTTASWATPLVNFNGTPDPTGAAYVWRSITPVSLISGDQYSIVGLGFNGADENYNTNIAGVNGSSPISFDSFGGKLTNGVSRFGGSGDPSSSTIWPFASAFGAASLEVSVPEPAAWALMLLGLGAVGATARIGRRREAAGARIV